MCQKCRLFLGCRVQMSVDVSKIVKWRLENLPRNPEWLVYGISVLCIGRNPQTETWNPYFPFGVQRKPQTRKRPKRMFKKLHRYVFWMSFLLYFFFTHISANLCIFFSVFFFSWKSLSLTHSLISNVCIFLFPVSEKKKYSVFTHSLDFVKNVTKINFSKK